MPHTAKISQCIAYLVAIGTLWACSTDDEASSSTSDSTSDVAADTVVADTADFDSTEQPDVDTGQPDSVEDTISVDDQGRLDEGEASLIVGGVGVFEIRAPDIEQLESGGAVAAFLYRTTPEDETPLATVELCTIRPTDPDAELFPDEATLDAGTVQLVIGGEALTLNQVETGDGPRYRGSSPEDRIEYFTAGQEISFNGTGGTDVPAFSGRVTAPVEPVVTSPSDWGGMFPSAHSTSSPLVVSWAGGSADAAGEDAVINLLPVAVSPEPGIAEGNGITCIVPNTGSYTIPAQALGYLPTGGGFGPNVALTIVVADNLTLEVGSSEIVLNATATHTIVGAVE